MKVVNVVESDNLNYYTKKIKFDDNVQIDSLINILKQFETDEIKLSVCHCNTFDSDGNRLYRRYHTIDDIAKISEAPSPYVDFSADFYSKTNMVYCFSILASVNSDILTYVVDKKKLSDNVSRHQFRK